MKNQKLRIGFWLASLSLLLCVSVLQVGGAARPGKTSNPDVVATIFPTNGLNSDVAHSNSDSYTSLGSDEVFNSGPSELGNWVLNLADRNLTGRTVYVDLTPLSGSGSWTIPANWYTGIVSSRCYDTNLNSVDFWAIGDTVGAPNYDANCSLNLNVDGYLIAMSPEYPGSTTTPGSTTATVTCVSKSGSPCTSWTITPTGGTSGTAVVIQNYGTRKAAIVGTATNSFSITVCLSGTENCSM